MAERTRDDDGKDNPLRDLVEIINNRAARHTPPRPETDRRGNYRESPTPPGFDLTATAIEDTVRRDQQLIEHIHEVAHATAADHATQRRSIRIDAASGLEVLDYLDAHRSTLPAELRARIDATADRIRRQAYESNTGIRLVCPHCNGRTVVPLPDLSALVCLDYTCAPHAPRVIDPRLTQRVERRITLRDLALMAGIDQATVRKRVQRARIRPVHVGPHNQHEYRWADVKDIVAPKAARALAA